jgi:hypothetical protein
VNAGFVHGYVYNNYTSSQNSSLFSLSAGWGEKNLLVLHGIRNAIAKTNAK